MPSIAEKYKAELDAAWKAPQEKPEDVWFYQKFLGGVFIGFVEFVEKVFTGVSGKFKVLEQRVKAIEDLIKQAATQGQPHEAQGEAAPPVGNGTGNGHPPTPAGQQSAAAPAPPQRQGLPPGDTREMVRLGGDNEPMSPEDQEREERMDLVTDGKIDDSRYIHRDRV